MNLLLNSNIWLEGKRETLLSSAVDYIHSGTTLLLNATKGVTNFEEVNGDNVLTEVTSTDFILRSSDLNFSPVEGDMVVETIGTTRYTYEVKAFSSARCYSEDNYKLSTRVTTVLTNETTIVPLSTYYSDDAETMQYFFDDAETMPMEVAV